MPGFLWNRLQLAIVREALHIVGTFSAIAEYLYPELSTASAPQAVLADKVARGESGARGGRGFYAYPQGAHEALIRERDARLLALRQVLAPDAPAPRAS